MQTFTKNTENTENSDSHQGTHSCPWIGSPWIAILSFGILLGALSAPLTAQALIEIRGGYSSLNAEPTGFTSAFKSTSAACPSGCDLGFKGTAGLAADVIVSPPLFPIGFGLRIENFQSKPTATYLNGSSTEFTFKYNRLALLVNYRLIDTLVYLGPIASFGIGDTATLDYSTKTLAGTVTSSGTLTPGSKSSYSVGVEAGASLMMLMAGLEVGYSSLSASSLKDSSSNTLTFNGNNLDNVSMSGMYYRINLGVSF